MKAESRRKWASLLPNRSDYTGLRSSWRGDITAGITVGIVALPLALAFGVSSGAGAESGIITAIVAGIIAAIFGGSNVQVSGPTGAMVVVLAPIISTHGMGSLALLCVMSGAIVLLGGILGLGGAVAYIPWPVVEGFTLGIAVLIFLQQIPTATGTSPGESSNAIISAIQALETAESPKIVWSLALVLLTATVMLVVPKLHRSLPASLIAISFAGVLVAIFGLPVDTIGELPKGLPAMSIPDINVSLVRELIGPACAAAALVAIESLLSVRVAATLGDTGPYNADRELVGQGIASMVAGVFGGMPATGAIARTAVNVRAGARTRVAAITHGVLLAIVVLAGAAIVSHIPLAALAGVLMVTATRMVSVATATTIIRSTRADALVFAATAIVTVSIDLIYAVGVGIAAAAFFALRQLARSSRVERDPIPGIPEPGDERIAILSIDGALFFGAAERVLSSVDVDDLDVVIIRMSQVHMLDATGAQMVANLVLALEREGVTVLVKGILPKHLALAERVGVLRSLRHQNHLFDELTPAIEHARSHVRRANPLGGNDADGRQGRVE